MKDTQEAVYSLSLQVQQYNGPLNVLTTKSGTEQLDASQGSKSLCDVIYVTTTDHLA